MIMHQLNDRVNKLSPRTLTQTIIKQPTTILTSANVRMRKPPHCFICKHMKLAHSQVDANISKCVLYTMQMPWHDTQQPDTNL